MMHHHPFLRIFHENKVISLKMNFLIPVFSLFLLPLSVYSFTDESHYSVTFGTTRFFRVFTPVDYNAENCSVRYPVIYYFHGCGGSYKSSGTYSYIDYGLTAPAAIGRKYDPAYEYPNNADFENFADQRDVIIVCADGKLYDLREGCDVYFPANTDRGEGKYYDFSLYMRELFEVVDSRYNTKTGPEYRAVSGLSMGGHTAIWIAAANPHLFSSASEFCHSPQFYKVGEPDFLTTVDVQQLWRNLRGFPFRHSTNDRDYLRYYTSELFSLYSGAGFHNEFYLADFCNHHAARIDLQFDFHVNHFSSPRERNPCFSYINLYPGFEIRGYELTSSKKGNGWIYLHSVSKNGLGLYTRQRLPWGRGLPAFDITLITPAIYTPDRKYSISRYNYHDDSITNQEIAADSQGRLRLTSSGGMGEEIGITGEGLQPPVFVLADTVNENIYLTGNVETALSFDVVNLSASAQNIDFFVSTENTELLTIQKTHTNVTIPAMSRIRVDSLCVCKGVWLSSYRNTGYIKIASSIGGIDQERDCLLQVTVMDKLTPDEPIQIKIFDGRKEKLSLFKYEWGAWNDPISRGIIHEGSGNGNGHVEMGETFSIWIESISGFDSSDLKTWHPVVPVNRGDNPDIYLTGVKEHFFNTGRPILSAEIRLNRKPTREKPVRIPVQSEFLKVQHLENDCHRPVADNFEYFFFELLLYEDGTVGMERMGNTEGT